MKPRDWILWIGLSLLLAFLGACGVGSGSTGGTTPAVSAQIGGGGGSVVVRQCDPDRTQQWRLGDYAVFDTAHHAVSSCHGPH